MKNFIKIGLLALSSVALLTSCDDFLNDHRYPLTSQTDNPGFWSNESNAKNEAAWLYNQMPGYGNFYFPTLSDDQAGRVYNQSSALHDGQNWLFTSVPNSSSGGYTDWKDLYEILRHTLNLKAGVEGSSLDEKVKNNYIGIARLNRAWFTYELVKRYGDVVWLDEVVDVDSPVLYASRENRDVVMDKVLEDLNYAIANITTEKSPLEWSVDLARAMKAEICLYEGTFCKYRTQAENGYAPNLDRANSFLKACVDACTPLMANYSLADNYLDLYQTMSVGSFTKLPELIFGKAYSKDVLMHSTIAYTCSSTQISGITRDAFEAFLFNDGLPLSKTSCDTNDEGYMKTKVEDGTSVDYYYIGDVLANRDQRLSWLTDTVAYCKNMTWKRANAGDMDATTGYGVRKYDNVAMELYNRQTIGQNYTCEPIFWLSVVLCEYAEAKAELGELNNTDLDNSLNKLYKRAGLPAATVESLAAINDPKAAEWGVSSLIFEVRRCRRCELMCDRDFRYWDLIRWHQLDKLDTNNYPNTMLGANMAKATALGDADLKFTGTYLNASLGARVYDKRNYLYPIPTTQLTLNENLKQNPGW